MLQNVELLANLAFHEIGYNSAAGDLRTALLHSKASILEVCGWVEQAMDQVVLDTAIRCGLSAIRIDQVERNYVKKTYGFDYQKHFERMFTSVVGFRILEQAEVSAGAAAMNPLTSTLSALYPLRNHYAHTHFDVNNPYPKNFTSIPTPTVMKQHAAYAGAGLAALEQALIGLNC